MWAVDDEVYGLSIDLETRTLRWFVHAGCACDFDDAYTKQTPQQFLTRGVPGGVADPPDDVLAAMQQSAAWLATTEPAPESQFPLELVAQP
jgi:hypothetical protein